MPEKTKEMSIRQRLAKIQDELEAPKSEFNKFGNYHYRTNEGILKAVKPLCEKYDTLVYQDDSLEMIGDRYYVKATSYLIDLNDEEKVISSVGWAREEENKKGMDSSQVTGATSSYARKYSLNGLFAIDDTKDSDSTNGNDKPAAKTPAAAPADKKPTVATPAQKNMLLKKFTEISQDNFVQWYEMTYTGEKAANITTDKYFELIERIKKGDI